jgi:hypothetical protein
VSLFVHSGSTFQFRPCANFRIRITHLFFRHKRVTPQTATVTSGTTIARRTTWHHIQARTSVQLYLLRSDSSSRSRVRESPKETTIYHHHHHHIIMTSCRIDFESLGGMCERQTIKLSRTQPAALASHIPDVNWTTFCDRIDAALEQLNSTNGRFRIVYMFCIRLFLLPFLVIVPARFAGAFGPAVDHTPTNSTQQQEDPPIIIWVFVIIFCSAVAAFFCMLGLSCYVRLVLSRVVKDIQVILDDVSEHYSDLTFHLKRGGSIYYVRRSHRPRFNGYIEVIISNVQAYVASPYKHEQSTADRLTELDRISGMLSEEEYADKRKEILESV